MRQGPVLVVEVEDIIHAQCYHKVRKEAKDLDKNHVFVDGIGWDEDADVDNNDQLEEHKRTCLVVTSIMSIDSLTAHIYSVKSKSHDHERLEEAIKDLSGQDLIVEE